MATPSLANYNTINSTFQTNFTSPTSTLDAGNGAGNLDGFLVLIIVACDSAARTQDITIDDVNYTRLFIAQNVNDISLACFFKAGVDSESNPTISFDSGSEAFRCYNLAISGWDSNTPLHDQNASDAPTDHVCPTVTATAEALVIRVCSHQDSNVTYDTIPETTIEQGNSGSMSSTGVQMGLAQTTKNNEATGTATFVTASGVSDAKATIVVQGAAAASGIPKTSKITLLGVG